MNIIIMDLFKDLGFQSEKSIHIRTMTYDWEKEKLTDSELINHFQDIEFCSTLKIKTLTCEACGLRLRWV